MDTDVIIAALRNTTGASAELLRFVDRRICRLIVSVPLVLEYESVVTRAEHLEAAQLSRREAETFLDGLVSLADWTRIYFQYRPVTRDPADEMVVEAAVNGHAEAIVTFNRRDYGTGPSSFGIGCWLPHEALEKLR